MAKAGKIQINEASPEELAELPGIGPATAEMLVKLRKQRGGFKSADELEAVPGIGAQTLKNLRSRITVSGNGGQQEARTSTAKAAERGAEVVERGAGAAASNGAAAAGKVAEKTAEAGQAQADTLRKAGEAQAETARRVTEAQAETVSRMTMVPADAGRRAAESGAAKAQEATHEAAALQQDLLGVMRDTQAVWLALLQEQTAANLEAARRLASCRSPQEWASLQADYLRESMERMVHGTAGVAAPATRLVSRIGWPFESWRDLVLSRR